MINESEPTVAPSDRTRIVEPKFFRVEIGGKSLVVIAKTRRGAAKGLAARLTSEIEAGLEILGSMEIFLAGRNGAEVVDLTAAEAEIEDQGAAPEAGVVGGAAPEPPFDPPMADADVSSTAPRAREGVSLQSGG